MESTLGHRFRHLYDIILCAQKSARNEALKYDLSNEENSKGVVSEVKEFSCPVTGKTDVHLVVKLPEDKAVLVHLAPPRFLKEYGFSFAKGDQIEVLGAKTKTGEEESVLARKVERGTDTYTVCDKAVNLCGNCQVKGQPQVSNGQRGRLPAWEAISGVAAA